MKTVPAPMVNSRDQTVRRITSVIKWGIALAAAAVIAPIVFLAIKGVVGIAVAGVLGLVIVNMAEPVAFMLANLRLKAIKAQARANPIETLQNQLAEYRDRLTRFRSSIEDYDQTVRTFADRVDQFKRQVPDEAPKYEAILTQMRQLLEQRRAAYRQAKDDVDQLAQEIGRQQAIYAMSEAAQRTQQELSGRAEVTFEIKSNEAFNAIQSSLNRSMAQLSTALLSQQDHEVIDVSAKLVDGVKHEI